MAESLVDPLSVLDTALILRSAMILAFAYILSRAATALLARISERAYGYRITIKMIIPLLKFSIYGLAIYLILHSVLVLSSAQALAVSGLAGAALGFGLKDLVAEVVGGIIIVLDKPYQVGDKVRIGEAYGEVRDIGLRSTRLVTPDDSLVSVSNQLVLSQVFNANAGSQEMMVVIDLYIDPHSDAALARRIAFEALVTSRYIRLSPSHPAKVLVKDFPFYRRLRAKGYVYDLRHEFDLETDVTARAWLAFKGAGIEAPRGWAAIPA
ncbi:MAG: mechanosensitive ion channel [Methanotrichaceae archaeon]|nr:mechanosensitive ion channel [Methanotrichaceae archaeon]